MGKNSAVGKIFEIWSQLSLKIFRFGKKITKFSAAPGRARPSAFLGVLKSSRVLTPFSTFDFRLSTCQKPRLSRLSTFEARTPLVRVHSNWGWAEMVNFFEFFYVLVLLCHLYTRAYNFKIFTFTCSFQFWKLFSLEVDHSAYNSRNRIEK